MYKQQELWPTEIFTQVQRRRVLPVTRAMISGESLSSWIVRIADAHGMSTQQLGAWLMGRGRQIFAEDVDRGFWDDLVEAISHATGHTVEVLMRGTLRSFEGVIWGEMPRQGATRWVLPILKRGTQRSGYGVQYCAQCLATDETPYLRLIWRLAFVVACPEHRCFLEDRCNSCQAPVAIHRWRTGVFRDYRSSGIVRCHECGADRRMSTGQAAETESLAAQERMLNALRPVPIIVDDSTVHCLAYFAGVAMIWSLLDDLRNADAVWGELELKAPTFVKDAIYRYGGFERKNVQQRAALLGGCDLILSRGVEEFVERLGLKRISSHSLLRYRSPLRAPAPFWYWSFIRQHLDRTLYTPCDEEIEEAIHYQLRIGGGHSVKVRDLCALLGMATNNSIKVARRMRELGVINR